MFASKGTTAKVSSLAVADSNAEDKNTVEASIESEPVTDSETSASLLIVILTESKPVAVSAMSAPRDTAVSTESAPLPASTTARSKTEAPQPAWPHVPDDQPPSTIYYSTATSSDSANQRLCPLPSTSVQATKQ